MVATRRPRVKGAEGGAPPASQGGGWGKVLYRRQAYDDNYTDETFLQSLVLNANAQQRDYWHVVRDSAAVTQQLSAVAAAVVAFVYMQQGVISVRFMLGLDVGLLLVGGVLYLACGPRPTTRAGALRGARQSLLLVVGVYLMSPALRSLTLSISTDTIVATTGVLFLLHLYLHDYNFVNNVTEHIVASLSLGAAVCGCVLLASRLPSDVHVFAQILFSLELFILSPFLRRHVRRASPAGHVVLTGLMVGGSLSLLLPLSRVLASAFVTAILFVSLVCPMWLVRIHKYKNEIRGPWDEAKPVLLHN